MLTTKQPTPRAAGEAVKAFREYLAVHPDACTGMGGHAMDDMALDLARIALNFLDTAPAQLHQICEQAAPAVVPAAQLVWSAPSPPNDKCSYDHIVAQSPIGTFSIEWKSWKSFDTRCLYLEGEFLAGCYLIEDAQAEAAKHLAGLAGLLAPYVTATATATDDSVRQAIRDYHFALDNRQHGGLAADKALMAIEAALGTRWVQGKELAARAAPGAAQRRTRAWLTKQWMRSLQCAQWATAWGWNTPSATQCVTSSARPKPSWKPPCIKRAAWPIRLKA